MPTTWQLKLSANVDNLKEIRDFIEDKALETGLCQDKVGNLVLAVDEVVSNIIMHATPKDEGTIEIKFQYSNQQCTVDVFDNTPLFNPLIVETNSTGSPLDNAFPGGYGLSLIRNLINKLSYQVTSDSRNRLTLHMKY